jgi:hypothetical protein
MSLQKFRSCLRAALARARILMMPVAHQSKMLTEMGRVYQRNLGARGKFLFRGPYFSGQTPEQTNKQ